MNATKPDEAKDEPNPAVVRIHSLILSICAALPPAKQIKFCEEFYRIIPTTTNPDIVISKWLGRIAVRCRNRVEDIDIVLRNRWDGAVFSVNSMLNMLATTGNMPHAENVAALARKSEDAVDAAKALAYLVGTQLNVMKSAVAGNPEETASEAADAAVDAALSLSNPDFSDDEFRTSPVAVSARLEERRRQASDLLELLRECANETNATP